MGRKIISQNKIRSQNNVVRCTRANQSKIAQIYQDKPLETLKN